MYSNLPTHSWGALPPATPTHSLDLDCSEQHKRHDYARGYANKPKYDGHDRLLSPHNIWYARLRAGTSWELGRCASSPGGVRGDGMRLHSHVGSTINLDALAAKSVAFTI